MNPYQLSIQRQLNLNEKLRMQYIVSQIQGFGSPVASEGKIFNSLSDAVSYIQKTSNYKRLLMDQEEASLEKLQQVLNERLSTVLIFGEGDAEKKWIITVF